MALGKRCTRCGQLNPQFATGFGDGFEYVGSDLCMSCRHGKRPGSQYRGSGLQALKDLLWSMNRRKKKKEVRT